MDEQKEAIEAPKTIEQVEEKEAVEAPAAAATLSGLVIKFHDLIVEAQALVATYRAKHLLLNDRHANADAAQSNLINIKKDLEEREAKVKRIENIEQLQRDALAMQKDYNDRLNGLTESENNNKRAVADFKKETIEQRAQTQREASAVIAQRNAIEEEVNRRVKKTLTDMGVIKETPVADAQVSPK